MGDGLLYAIRGKKASQLHNMGYCLLYAIRGESLNFNHAIKIAALPY
ncbi:MAG: hypothetical protein KatS3mg087_2123 [Patescibacteria group bacterium]|nr:MAG: hypothetical protein KatS3mg087_2123 [Patescibacteria group bacterium]